MRCELFFTRTISQTQKLLELSFVTFVAFVFRFGSFPAHPDQAGDT